MDAAKAPTLPISTGDDGPNTASAASMTNANIAVDGSSASAAISISRSDGGGANDSEDVLIFGARSSHLFDNIAIAIDSLLTEEVATLPLLPRKLTEQEMRQHQQQTNDAQKKKSPQTGEQKLIAHLRKAYKKNIDAAETYCNRNIFTVQHHSKTKRRQILEQYFDTEKDDQQPNSVDQSTSAPASTATATMASFTPLPNDMEIPTPDHIMNMDKEILETRQRIQLAKQRRIQQSRQLGKLDKANQLLVGVLEALQLIVKMDDTTTGKRTNNDDDIAVLMQSLKQSVLNAMEGHEELKIWNVRAEEVLQLLDTIKIDRDERRGSGNNHHPNGNMSTTSRGNNSGGGTKAIAEREEDERRRKVTLQEMGASHGTREQVASLLSKLRGN